MSNTIVILVNGEVLAGSYGSTIKEQRDSARTLAEGLLPIISCDLKVAIMHGNKPQVGYVLFRSELASHVLHPIPLDICGADTQGATGYMLNQEIHGVLRENGCNRNIVTIVTQTIVNSDSKYLNEFDKPIGPWMDFERAERRRQAYGWHIVEDPGYGFQRGVPSPPPIEIVEIEGIKQLVDSGMIVITAGGGGIPVVSREQGRLEGVEAVVDTDQVAGLLAQQLKAKAVLMVVDSDKKFIMSGISTEQYRRMSLLELENFLDTHTIHSDMVARKFNSIVQYLKVGGEQVVITTLRKLPEVFNRNSGLWIEVDNPSVDLYDITGMHQE